MRAATIAAAVDRAPLLPAANCPTLPACCWPTGPAGSTAPICVSARIGIPVPGATSRPAPAVAQLALVEHVLQTDRAGALLVDVGLIDPPSGAEARPAPKPNTMADVAAAILVAAVPADDTPAREYLARRRTWPPAGPDLPPAVRWLPPSAWANLPTWPGPDGRPRRLTPPRDGVTRLVAGTPPVPACGAVVELARPGCASDAVELEAVTAAGNRPAERWRRSKPATCATARPAPAT